MQIKRFHAETQKRRDYAKRNKRKKGEFLSKKKLCVFFASLRLCVRFSFCVYGSVAIGQTVSPLSSIQNKQSFFPRVTPGRDFSFPQDHNIHADFQTEWWYVTANLLGADGLTYGAQFTLFR